jgi:hypothetical protein
MVKITSIGQFATNKWFRDYMIVGQRSLTSFGEDLKYSPSYMETYR